MKPKGRSGYAAPGEAAASRSSSSGRATAQERTPSKKKRTPRRSPAADDVARARRVLAVEANAIRRVGRRLDRGFARAVDLLAACRGKVVVTGTGKSGQICRKIASTLASTGTPAFFLHAAEGMHGDFGMLMRGDAVIAISNSGETEVTRILPLVKRLALPLVAMTGAMKSTLAGAADVVLDCGVEEEACPMGLAPTASTTATLALGDALAVAVLERRGFSRDDFAVLHPGGQLGRRLLRVDELAHTGQALPLVNTRTPLREALREMSEKRLGITGIVDASGDLVGVLTDGDLRRGLQRHTNLIELTATQVMTTNPKTVPAGALAEQALAVMEQHSITSLFVLRNGTRRPVGIVHMHDLLKAGVI